MVGLVFLFLFLEYALLSQSFLQLYNYIYTFITHQIISYLLWLSLDKTNHLIKIKKEIIILEGKIER